LKTQSQITELYRSAADETAPLVELAGRPSTADPSRFGPLFRRLRDRLATLPISQETYAVLTNMITDSEVMIARREFGAAQWQLRQTMRRLRRLEGDWEEEAGTAGRQITRVSSSRRSDALNEPEGVKTVEA
jgi:hypothetical protein